MILTKEYSISKQLENVFISHCQLGVATPGTISDLHQDEFDKNFKLGQSELAQKLQNQISQLIQKYWDCFANEGAQRPIIGYEFAIDTGQSKPICCRKPQYGPHESKIIMNNIQTLLDNNWIKECGGPWGSMIVLAPKPHQEHVTDIKDFVWRMCVSYRQLNSITKPFEYPIPRCDDAVDSLVTCIGNQIHFISLDAKQGYHQVQVKHSDKEKLAFFSPNNKKYTFTVMPFGPTNAPAFYTAMMHDFQLDWEKLFLETIPTITPFMNLLVQQIEKNKI